MWARSTPVAPRMLELSAGVMESNNSTDLTQFNIDVAMDNKVQLTAAFGNSLTIPLSSAISGIQLTLRNNSASASTSFEGSITFPIADLLSLKSNEVHKHWVTLFDDPKDDVYDGNYREHDTDLPRVLLVYNVREVLAQNRELISTTTVATKEDLLRYHSDLNSASIHNRLSEAAETYCVSFGPGARNEEVRANGLMDNKLESQVLPASPDKKQRQQTKSSHDSFRVQHDTRVGSKEAKDPNSDVLFTLTEGNSASIEEPQCIQPVGHSHNPPFPTSQPEAEISNVPTLKGVPESGEKEPRQLGNGLDPTSSQINPNSISGSLHHHSRTSLRHEERANNEDDMVTITQEDSNVVKNPRLSVGSARLVPAQSEAMRTSVDRAQEEITKFKQELETLERENVGLRGKLEETVANFEAQTASYLKEKQDLLEHLANIEHQLVTAEESRQEMQLEQEKLKTFYERERELRTEELQLQASQFEARLQELQGRCDRQHPQTEFGYSQAVQRVTELGLEYEQKMCLLHAALLDSECKSRELLQQLQDCTHQAEELALENKALKSEKLRFTQELQQAKAELVNVMQESQKQELIWKQQAQRDAGQLGQLLQENVHTKTQAEELRILLEEAKAKLKMKLHTAQDGSALRMHDEQREQERESEQKCQDLFQQLQLATNELANKRQELDAIKEQCQTLHEAAVNKAKVIQALERLLSTHTQNTIHPTVHAETQTSLQDCDQSQSQRSLEGETERKSSIRSSPYTKTDKAKALISAREQVAESATQPKGIIATPSREKSKVPITENQKGHTKNLQQERTKGAKLATTSTTEAELSDHKQKLTDSKQSYSALQEQVANLNSVCKAKSEENQVLSTALEQYKAEVHKLKSLQPQQPGRSVPPQKPVSAEGDAVDRVLAEHVAEARCPVSLTKIGPGQYIFGTKKIFARLQNGKMVIRIGGGYLRVDEFLAVYTAQELHKRRHLQDFRDPRLSPWVLRDQNRPEAPGLCLDSIDLVETGGFAPQNMPISVQENLRPRVIQPKETLSRGNRRSPSPRNQNLLARGSPRFQTADKAAVGGYVSHRGRGQYAYRTSPHCPAKLFAHPDPVCGLAMLLLAFA